NLDALLFTTQERRDKSPRWWMSVAPWGLVFLVEIWSERFALFDLYQSCTFGQFFGFNNSLRCDEIKLVTQQECSLLFQWLFHLGTPITATYFDLASNTSKCMRGIGVQCP